MATTATGATEKLQRSSRSGRGVFAGAKMPYQPSIAKSGKPASSMVGRSGADGERLAQVCASALTSSADAPRASASTICASISSAC